MTGGHDIGEGPTSPDTPTSPATPPSPHSPPSVEGAPRLHVAAVHGRDEVHHLVAARDRESLLRALAEYLEHEVDLQLWEEDAARFRALLSVGDAAGAVELYARSVGERWDRDRIRIEEVPVA